MKKWIRLIVILAIVALAVMVVVMIASPDTDKSDYKTRAARIKSISQMVDLCTADIHEEVAVKDSINGKWIVARQTIKGHIRFDLDSLRFEQRGDTTIVFLPPERVDILENADPGAYEVLDVWDGRRPIFERTLTAAEENVLKTRWQQRARKRIYARGYVKDARANAVASLTPLLNAMKGPYGDEGEVIIIDPTPDGNP